MTQSQLAQFAPCPKCGSTSAKKVSFTWWGGALGPRLFNHVQCTSCNTQYNGKTGQANTNNIIIYTIVSVLIAFCACGGMTFLLTFLNNQ